MYEMLKNVCKQNCEIKNDLTLLRTQFMSFNTEIEAVKNDNKFLKEENRALSLRIRTLEKNNRANNLIFYNIKYDDNEQLHHVVKHFLDNKLDVSLELYEIANIHRLGKKVQDQNKNPPILVSLTSNLRKREILANVGKLKGSGIGVSEDLNEEERLKKKVIYNHYKTAKINNCPAKLYKNSVVINGVSYTYEDIQGSKAVTRKQGAPGTFNSQPVTPTTDINADEVFVTGNKELRITRENKTGTQAGLGKEARLRSNSLKSTISSAEQAVPKKGAKNK